jgi:hypothetical protein
MEAAQRLELAESQKKTEGNPWDNMPPDNHIDGDCSDFYNDLTYDDLLE